MATKKKPTPKSVEALRHDDASRRNIPTAEYQSVVEKENDAPKTVTYSRAAAALADEKSSRNRDLDPQLVWRGKDEQDWSDLVVPAPPLYIQEKVHPKVLIDDLLRQTAEARKETAPQIDLFADFNGLPEGADKTEFYAHEQNWSNRMILGDSLRVMASLAEREGLRGKVQCIYLDPPYGIKFNSNFQWSTTSRDVKDGNTAHITREPEQVKAFRDTWRDGIHSYLTYLRDRLVVARDLLTESGSIFVQIGDENVHRVRAVMDEVFGDENCIALITFMTTASTNSPMAKTLSISRVADGVLWFAKSKEQQKYRQLFRDRRLSSSYATTFSWIEMEDGSRRRITGAEGEGKSPIPDRSRAYSLSDLTGQNDNQMYVLDFQGRSYQPGKRGWRTTASGMERLKAAERIVAPSEQPRFVNFGDDFAVTPINNVWTDTGAAGFSDWKVYVVQTNAKVIQRCILMASDPGDLVLDPTCGSGTTALVAEEWGRRWITIDTSRVALALARARIMGARYPFYLLADSRDGQAKEAEVTRTMPSSQPVRGSITHGFVYERVPHVTLKSIANNAEIDVIWEKAQKILEPLREKLNAAAKQKWEEWEIPREADPKWPVAAKSAHADWWQARIARQKEIDASIAAKAEFEFLYDKPYVDNKKVRVAGPFTVESLSPHRMLGVDENDELIDPKSRVAELGGGGPDYATIILDNLRAAGVQQAHKEDRITFTSLVPWPGDFVCAEGRYQDGESEKRAAVFLGPEFGTVQRIHLVEAAREAADAGFDVLIACAFNYEAHTTEFAKLGKLPVLKARMNADLHMAEDLKTTNKANLFVIFGEPDIDLEDEQGRSLKTKVDGKTVYKVPKGGKLRVKVLGVDVFHPQTGEVRSDGPEGIACWFVDTDYNEESFFVRAAYFLGANDPYQSLKTTLKSEIDEDAWQTLHSDVSRPFEAPSRGRIAVKVINHLGDEVMKVFRVE